MKKILYILMAIAILAGCKKPGNEPSGDETGRTLAEKIEGEWHCSPSNIDADIYVSFTDDGKFELYQQITAGAYRLYRGKWNTDETKSVISGTYNDGEPWGSSYSAVVSEDGNSMTLKDSASNEYVYSRQEIPASVKDNCVVEVKSPYAY